MNGPYNWSKVTQKYANLFHWHDVVLNLPSSINYDPGLPRVLLVQKDNKRAFFFDDGRVHGPAGGLVHAALHRSFTGLQYLGNQIDLRNYLLTSSRPSAWNGCCVYTDQMLPRKILSQIKWDRLKNNICSVKEYADKNKNPS